MKRNLTFTLERRDHVVIVVRPTEELGQDLDRLPAREQIVEWNTRNTCKLSVVDEAHKLVNQALRKICILIITVKDLSFRLTCGD